MKDQWSLVIPLLFGQVGYAQEHAAFEEIKLQF